MTSVPVTQLRGNLYQLLDEAVAFSKEARSAFPWKTLRRMLLEARAGGQPII